MKKAVTKISVHRNNMSLNCIGKYFGKAKQFLHENSGASSVEYIFMVSGIFVIATGVAIAIEDKITELSAIF